MIRRPPRSTQSRSSAASDVYKRQDLEFGIIQSYTCGDEANCMTGRVGIMGTRYYNDNDNNVFSPLAFLPDNLSSGYLVAATGPTPSIIPVSYTHLRAHE